MDLRLRPPRADDEDEALAAHHELSAEDFSFLLGRDEAGTWGEYLQLLERRRRGEGLTGRLVPSTFLIAEAGGQLVGRASIRHELNAFLMHEGGHIGYCVRPAHRRRGHAGEILRQSLIVARAAGVERVLVTCDEGNFASARAIEGAGGTLEDVRRGADGLGKRRYWFE
jgi:predicted acetyltransferase